jgi:hypothetical protein
VTAPEQHIEHSAVLAVLGMASAVVVAAVAEVQLAAALELAVCFFLS